MAIRNDFTAGEVLAAADLNDTFAAKADDAATTTALNGKLAIPDLVLINGPSGTSLTGSSVTVNLSGKSIIHVYVVDYSASVGSSAPNIRINSDSGNNYFRQFVAFLNTSLFQSSGVRTGISGSQIDGAGDTCALQVTIHGCAKAGYMPFNGVGNVSATGTASLCGSLTGFYQASAAVTSISVVPSAGTMDNGTVYVYAA